MTLCARSNVSPKLRRGGRQCAGEDGGLAAADGRSHGNQDRDEKAHVRVMRKAGWSGAIRRSSSSDESGPTPEKNTPTSNFHFFRYARRRTGFSSSASSTAVNGCVRRPTRSLPSPPARRFLTH